jgi:hypothetical protein
VTQRDADRLARWLDTLDARQLGALWKWVTMLWINRARAEFEAWTQRDIPPSWHERRP